MIYRIILGISIFLISCENNNKPYDIIISGKVTDQVTGEIIKGATVSCGKIPGLMPGGGLLSISNSTFSDSNGLYKLITQSQSSEGGASLTTKTYSLAVLANKKGYAQSIRQEIYYLDAQNTTMDFELFHYCQLNLHIKNDTINNEIDAVDIKASRSNPNGIFQEAYIICNTRKLDSVFEIKNIPANVNYNIQVLSPGGASFSPQIVYTILPNPDVINYFDISF